MKRIVFVTSNINNLENAHRYLDSHKISVVKYSCPEIMSNNEDLQDTVTRKAKLAYQKVQEPCFVMESFFAIEALNGFPGTHTKYVFETIGVDGILRLMEGIENRSCVYRHCLGYYDGVDMHYYFDEEHGTLASRKAGEGHGNHLSQIFIPDDFQATLQDHFLYRPKVIEQFAKYLNEHTATLIDEPYDTHN